MLIPLDKLAEKYNAKFKGCLQIGAHHAEENSTLIGMGIKNIIYIEPCFDSYLTMFKKITGVEHTNVYKEDLFKYPVKWVSDNSETFIFFRCACGEVEGQFDMYVSRDNQGQSNSLLKPNLHIFQHPEVRFNEMETVQVIPLDKLKFNREDYNLLMMDVQGAEGMVLKGAKETLPFIDYIYTECNRDETYSGNMQIDEMDEFLGEFGFERVETYWPSENWSWGDALYIRKTLL